MSTTICPYPGLRPFNEEESIFFKGREQQVERLVKRLEEKKFLMVNGASGDGKSSLIYAGVIPYAKAGFFKAKYNNWIVADFRPERSPLKNLTASLCRQLKIADNEATEKELSYGFSALCDLYKSSDYYIDETKAVWLNADEKERKSLKRKGANLLVLVDQFEEFFTNPENYQNGIPSIESQKTVNLLLETYQLAKAQNLPIYVVCTMRSDYIGQCAAFRGLPEAIGYSQFFVPRLKRQEIEQVIEGPAELAGCKISKRLTQTLLNSLTDGFDQLPILQHALNHIWKMAGNGIDEMDLIHLAMIGGLSPKMLSLEDRNKFNNWFETLAEYKKQLLEKPSLSNVLNAHANELYLTAHLHYKEKFGITISEIEAQNIIKSVFQCLTKIDASRAVRNRMTLQEITNILNDEKISTTKVDRLLQIYREQGNTFLQPFIGEQGENKELSATSVLDITHESLIRNWLQLTEWANEEYENLQNYLDFNKQLQRWINSNYNSGYLLPIGPLTYFENWFEKLNPSKYWINRYEDFEGDLFSNLEQAKDRLIESKKFITKSGKGLIVSKTVLKYGVNRIIGLFAFFAMMIAISYYYFDYRKKQNKYIVAGIVEQGIEMLRSPNISIEAKADFLINNDRLNELNNKPNEFGNLLKGLGNDTLAFDVAYAMISKCLSQVDSTHFEKEGLYTFNLFEFLFKNFEKDASREIEQLSKNENVEFSKNSRNRVNDFLRICAWLKYSENKKFKNKVDTIIYKTIYKTKWLMKEAIVSIDGQKYLGNRDLLFTFDALIAIDDHPNYTEFINLISPLENKIEASNRFDSIFKRNNTYQFGCQDLQRQGGFHLLSLLYASQFQSNITAITKLKILLDSSDVNNNYNPSDIYKTLLRCNNLPAITYDFIAAKYNDNEWEKAQFIGNRVQDLFNEFNIRTNFPSSLVGFFIPTNSVNSLFDLNEKLLLNVKTLNDSTKLNLAVFYKKKGFYNTIFTKGESNSDIYFEAAINYYNSVSEEYKLKKHYFDKVNWTSASDINAEWFLFPGVINEYQIAMYNCGSTTIGVRGLYNNLNYSPFLNYITKNNQVNLFNSLNGINALNSYYDSGMDSCTLSCLNILSNITNSNKSLTIDLNTSVNNELYSTYRLLQQKEIKKANLQFDSLFKTLPKDYNGAYKLIDKNAILLAKIGDNSRTLKLLRYVHSTPKKREILLKICYELQNGNSFENTFLYLNELLKDNSSEAKIGMGLFRLLGKIGSNKIERISEDKFRNIAEKMKPEAMDNWVLGTAENGNYYKAKNLIPTNVSETKELQLLNIILQTEIIKQSIKIKKNDSIGKWNDTNYFTLDSKSPIENGNNLIRIE